MTKRYFIIEDGSCKLIDGQTSKDKKDKRSKNKKKMHKKNVKVHMMKNTVLKMIQFDLQIKIAMRPHFDRGIVFIINEIVR